MPSDSTTSPIPLNPSLTRLSLLLICVGYLVAMLSPQHYLPLTAFYQDVAAGAAMVLAAITLLAAGEARTGLVVPWSALGVLGLAGVSLLSLRLRPVPYPDYMVWPVGSLVIAAMAARYGQVMRRGARAWQLVDALALSLGLTAIVSAGIVWLQLLHPGWETAWLFPRQTLQAPSGNLGQRNQAALVLAMGVLAVAHFTRHGSRAASGAWRVGAAVAGLFLLTALTLTQSRIALVFLALGGAAGGVLWARPDRRLRGGVAGLLAAGLSFAVVQWVIYSGFGLAQLFPSATQRLAERGVGQRLDMLHVAWAEWSANPWWGGGFSSFSNWELRLGLQQAHPLFSTNAHNIVAQLAAETGLIGLCALGLPIVYGLYSALRQARPWRLAALPAWSVLPAGVCLMMGAYSLTEFPLWYIGFLVPFALCWGLFDATALRLTLSKGGKVLLALPACVMLGYMAWASARYLDIVKMTAFVNDPELFAKHGDEYRRALRQLVWSPGLTPQVDALSFVAVPLDSDMLEQKIQLGQRTVGFLTGSGLLERLALLQALHREPEVAAGNLAKACAYYPDTCEGIGNDIEQLAKAQGPIFEPVRKLFVSMPQAHLRAPVEDVLKPWEQPGEGTVVVIDSDKTPFGTALVRRAAGLQALPHEPPKPEH